MKHFPFVLDFLPISKTFFRLPGKFSQILPFPQKIFDFHPLKFLMTFLLVIEISSCFHCFSTFPPYFTKIIIFPLLLTYFVFSFPPSLTMMHFCITQCTYRTSLVPCRQYVAQAEKCFFQ